MEYSGGGVAKYTLYNSWGYQLFQFPPMTIIFVYFKIRTWS